MDKFSYGSYSSSISDIVYSATNGYSNPSSELETRKQFSTPLKEVKDYINNTVPTQYATNKAVQLLVTSDNKLQYRLEPNGTRYNIRNEIPSGGTAGQVLVKNSSAENDFGWGDSLPILTTEPTEANTVGVKLVYLESEPATKYAGYIYFIKE